MRPLASAIVPSGSALGRENNMACRNLDQIRARNALAAVIGAGAEGGENVAKKVPVMIRDNGFIGAMAFAREKGKGYKDVFQAVIRHLGDVGRLHGMKDDFDGFLRDLCEKDSAVLRSVTEEAMAFLNYLRRFQE